MSNVNNAAENMELLSKETDVTKAIKEILGLSNQKTDDVQRITLHQLRTGTF